MVIIPFHDLLQLAIYFHLVSVKTCRSLLCCHACRFRCKTMQLKCFKNTLSSPRLNGATQRIAPRSLQQVTVTASLATTSGFGFTVGENQKPKRDSTTEESGKPHFIHLFKTPLDYFFEGFFYLFIGEVHFPFLSNVTWKNRLTATLEAPTRASSEQSRRDTDL